MLLDYQELRNHESKTFRDHNALPPFQNRLRRPQSPRLPLLLQNYDGKGKLESSTPRNKIIICSNIKGSKRTENNLWRGHSNDQHEVLKR